MNNSLSKKFSLVMVAFYSIFAIGPAFYVVLLEQKNVPTQNIGLYTALIALVAAGAQPIYGYLCDKTGKAKEIYTVTSILSVVFYALFVAVNSTVLIIILSICMGVSLNGVFGFAESWLSKLGCEENGVNFGAVRGIGSISYAIVAAVYGYVYDFFGMWSLPVCMGIFAAMLVFVVKSIPNPVPRVETHENKISFSVVFNALKKNKKYMLVLICYTLAAIPTGAVLSYYPARIYELGGTASSFGLAMLVLAGSEFFVMNNYKWIENKFGLKNVLAFAFLMYGIKNVAIGIAPNVTVAIAVAATQAFCFGLIVPGVQSFVMKNVEKDYVTTAQLLCNTGGQLLAQLPGAVLGGLLVKYMSIGNMLLIMSIFAFISFAIFMFATRKSEN